MSSPSFFRRYLLPGFVFQSVVIAGGYGTGRELVEFFLRQGPWGGLLAMGVSTLIWSVVCMATFEFARVFRAFDYRTFFRALLGRAWLLYELCYAVMLAVVLAVVAAAAGEIGREVFGIPYAAGVLAVMAAVGVLTFGGSRIIERFLAGWSFVLYGLYIVFFAWVFSRSGGSIGEAFSASQPGSRWGVDGVRYAAYNLGVIPAVLFTLRFHTRRRETLGAGLLTGPIAMIPALLFYLAMVGQYPQILDRPVPANHLLEFLGSRWFQITFQVVLFGTLIETGTGLIHAVNERAAHLAEETGRRLPSWTRPAIALILLLVGTLLSRFGLVGLIARGYGTLTWGFLLVFVIPVLTLGVWKLRERGGETAPGG